MEDDLSDVELLQRIRNADHSSFRVLLQRYSRSCYRVAYRILHEQSRAEDVVQDVMLKLWHKPELWDEKKSKGKFSSWLYRVVINAAIDDYRKNKRTLAVDDWEEFEGAQGGAAGVPRETQEARELEMKNMLNLFYAKLGELPLNQNVALVLCRIEGMSHKEAAEVMSITPKAVERCIDKAVKRLSANFAKEGVDITAVLAAD